MERLYNPDLMPEEEIKATFVARQDRVDEIVALIKHQPKGAGVQHAVIIAPRGMGKTTVLLMVRFAIQDSELAEKWQAVQFPEERYNIYDLADFWIEILSHLDEAAGGDDLRKRVENIKREYRNNDDLQEAALALIKDWCRKHKKRLVVLVDNFDIILEQINDERDNARLRDVLMNDGSMMLVGGATTFFHEARAYDQPLYNFFKIYELPNLKFEEMQDLLRRRAEVDKRSDFEETLKANKSRLRVLEHFTGGNPRLVLMLYRVVTQSDISEVKLGLEKLLDEVTPYYKAKVESLPPQQRKILDHIARASSQTNEGLTPTDIATATRMTPNQASAQLKRLIESGYVRAANIRGRSSYYTLSERLYAIWHQMRFGRNARERMGWLVNILKALYDAEEMGTQSNLLETRLYEHLKVGRLNEASDTLEHWQYLLEAMKDSPNCAQLNESSSAKAQRADLAITMNRAKQLLEADKNDEALQQIEHALNLQGNESKLWLVKGIVLRGLGRHAEALDSFDRALEIDSDTPRAHYYRGRSLMALERGDEAVDSFNNEPEINLDSVEASGRALAYMGKFVKSFEDGRLEVAKKAWEEVQNFNNQLNNDKINKETSELLLLIALSGQISFVRQLVKDSDIPEPLFPLARAIDYVQTGDESLLEKLSPEVRGVVEEIVAKLRQGDNQTNDSQSKKQKRKPKSLTRQRTRKQLH
jgi:tetratricopeptide (TPR) repeat protein/DNA-binding MarR family transcriptional regulator